MAKHGGFPMGGGMNPGMMNQIRKMQQNLETFQAEHKERPFEATSGGGMVKAVVNGDHKVLSIDIKPEAVDPDDVEMLSDMVIAAVNEAMKAADDANEEGMKKLTGGLNIGF